MTRFNFVVLAVLVFAIPAVAVAQPRNVKTEKWDATIKEVKQKGKSVTLVVDYLGEEHTFPITAKVTLEIQLTGGTEESLARGNFLEAKGLLTNGRVFLDEAKVYILAPNAKVPPSAIANPPVNVDGQSVNLRYISGQIAVRQTSKEYPDYEEMALRAPGTVPPIMFNKGIAVEIVSSNADDIKPGQAVELEVIPGRNDKVTLVRAVVTGGEYVAPVDEKAGKSRS
ncbi:hypothetical protein SH668x_002001 [Planctomicrobium sp. SH668]|uniref:hypothetical protein n=1 Tax=Planctomicrobium sp. SH668 TaxID=3448126 RepID=UPI003F5CB44D